MQNELRDQPGPEDLNDENRFLKMKLMLEKGANFYGNDDGLSPELEHEFLTSIMEFERQLESRRLIKIREKLGNPDPRPATEISEEEIGTAWHEFSSLLARNGLSISACSPRVTLRELYRFATEELLELEIDDMRIPGMMTCFIYDEFYPDPIYDCEQAAIQHCLVFILSKLPLQYDFNFAGQIELNGRGGLSFEEFAGMVNRFKELFNDINIVAITPTSCNPGEEVAQVEGTYVIDAQVDREWVRIEGKWEVELETSVSLGFRIAKRIVIGGISFV